MHKTYIQLLRTSLEKDAIDFFSRYFIVILKKIGVLYLNELAKSINCAFMEY